MAKNRKRSAGGRAISKMRAGGGKTYTWLLNPHGMYCYDDIDSFQTVTRLWETTELTEFHDAELKQATKEINGIFSALEKSNKDPERNLSFILFQDQLFLVWAKYGAVGSFEDEKTIFKELKLKRK